MEKRRVVITGIGVVSPVGNTKDDFWHALCEGKSGAGLVSYFDTTDFSSKIDAEIKNFEPSSVIPPKELKRMDKFVQFAVFASKTACDDSGLELDKEDRNRIGVIIGTGIGGLNVIEEQQKSYMEKGPKRISPFLIPMLIVNMAPGQVSISMGLKGPNSCVTTACATGGHCIGDAFKIIQRGDAEVMFAGGTESCITPLGFGGFCALKALSTRNDDPLRASRPFDRERDGFLMAEGAGIVVLEELEHAKKRGARIYAELAGYGMSGDAYHITAPDPDGDGGARCMSAALNDAGVNPEDVDYINAHGTSTPMNDKVETLAIKRVFGEYAKELAVSSTKSVTGHLLGAAGGVECAAAALTIKDGIIPPTINYEYPDPDCDLDYVPNTARKQDVKIAISNSLGFGGHNVTLVLKKI
ncbi:MAG: beta-ketoacyl-ACP synthase II [Candidatus Omnitrophica bacterium]|nr:beta-ketoacyl-ACP synthase II [Candidatus Omnitrophota bacterium]MBU4477478.1 beta-ketoacyl-ACP synthase II [Candidatus Omnitrophota bacterium]MCG2704282.1 beta-ketoacyl-ACP synthase II [Candidatus Omnitrophota bacterium]